MAISAPGSVTGKCQCAGWQCAARASPLAPPRRALAVTGRWWPPRPHARRRSVEAFAARWTSARDALTSEPSRASGRPSQPRERRVRSAPRCGAGARFAGDYALGRVFLGDAAKVRRRVQTGRSATLTHIGDAGAKHSRFLFSRFTTSVSDRSAASQ